MGWGLGKGRRPKKQVCATPLSLFGWLTTPGLAGICHLPFTIYHSSEMRQLLNTLFVTTQGAYVSREGETVLVRVEHETKLRVPIHTLGGIVCFGQVSCSPPLMELCGERNVAISFLSEHGKFYARVQGRSPATFSCGGSSTAGPTAKRSPPRLPAPW